MAEIRVTTDPTEIDLGIVHKWLSESSYWAIGRSRELVDQAARSSLNFGALDADGALVGYARVVTDYSTFAWVCDVFVSPDARGRGIGVLLADTIASTLRPMYLMRVLLATADAHGLYEKVGFERIPNPDVFMQLRKL